MFSTSIRIVLKRAGSEVLICSMPGGLNARWFKDKAVAVQGKIFFAFGGTDDENAPNPWADVFYFIGT
ncbi:hypothetical protein RHMOL_Rhmol13G0276300 [Rhododendron molle]|uniref:Uncharacterized protein n=1 Tax=Rhododendron molle TaxID=49168 RepID=A0ACC0LB70_RHOML|nr:hypothetical protein RHMOL_Rhmol13G0276300 [Rhododendron molle]